MKTLIVDDERLARQRLRRMLEKHPEIEIVGECADGQSALEAAREKEAELVLLDIKMPGTDGMEVAEKLGCEPLPIIIFVTAFDEHAVRAFEACALDYLLKPVSAARLKKALDRATDHLAILRAEGERAKPAESETLRYHVRNGLRTFFVAPEEIEWVEAGGNYSILHVGPERHLLRMSMSALEAELPKNFVRTSRFAIVNLRCVKELRASDNQHFAIMQDDSKVLVTGSIRELQEQLRRVR